MHSATEAGERWDESDLVMVSAIQHFSYCRRQCALIHLEQTFDENIHTMRGRALHETVDQVGSASEEGVRVERALPIWSDRLGLIGRADVVEFREGSPYPVEYKHGRKRNREHDVLQLCAQAICLEEMTGLPTLRGAIYYHSSRRRKEVVFDQALRARVAVLVGEIREMLRGRKMPPPVLDRRCRDCSLLDSCLPAASSSSTRVGDSFSSLFEVEDS